MFERFTDRARRVVVLAQEQSRLLGHDYIGTEHLLLGLSKEMEGVAGKVLIDLELTPEKIEEKLMTLIVRGTAAPAGHIPFTPRAKKVLELSLREALQLGHNYIGTEHILLGLMREGEGIGMQVLTGLGAGIDDVRTRILEKLNIAPSARSRVSLRSRLGRQISVSTSVFNEAGLSERVKRLLSFAIEEAEARGADSVDIEDVLLALFKEPDSVSYRVFERLDVSLDSMRNLVKRLRDEGEDGAAGTAS